MDFSRMSKMSKLIGARGLYLSFCRSLRINPRPIQVPIFGTIRTLPEIMNLHDNFGMEHLRDEKIERHLAQKSTPCVIDCGVNVGITVRWWFHLNPRASVFGIDMMQEAQAFTVASIQSLWAAEGGYEPIVAALWSESGKQFTINVGNPLWGENSLYQPGAEQHGRVVITKTLDEIVDGEQIGEIDLLKIDLEGAGGDALKGATRTLQKTKHICFEIHGEEECKLAGKILADHQFALRRISDRNLWWERE